MMLVVFTRLAPPRKSFPAAVFVQAEVFPLQPTCHVLASGLTGFMSSFRPSPGWGGCGGSSTSFGSTSGVYMPECTSSSGRPACLAKLRRTSMSHGERRALSPRRGRAEREALIDINNPIHVLQPAQPNGLSINVYTYLCSFTSRHAKHTKGTFSCSFCFYNCSETCRGGKRNFIAHIQFNWIFVGAALPFVWINKVSVEISTVGIKVIELIFTATMVNCVYTANKRWGTLGCGIKFLNAPKMQFNLDRKLTSS